MSGIGSLTSALTGILTAKRRLIPSLANFSPVLSALASASSESVDQLGVGRARHEGAGRQDAALRVAAAGERLDAGELLLAQVDLGLIPELDPAVARAPRRGRRAPPCGAGMAELELLHDLDDGGGLERLLEHRQHLQLVLLADALDVFEHGRAAVAHQLDEAEIAALAERDDRTRSPRRTSRPILRKTRSGVRRSIALREALRRRRIPRCRCRRRAGSATGSAGCSALRRRRSRCGTRRAVGRRRAGAVRAAGDCVLRSKPSVMPAACGCSRAAPRRCQFLAPNWLNMGFDCGVAAYDCEIGRWPGFCDAVQPDRRQA